VDSVGACASGGDPTAICVAGIYSSTWWNQPPSPLGANPAQTLSWTGTNGTSGAYPKGATVLNLSGTPIGLSVNDLLFLFQRDDAAPASGLFVRGACDCALDGSYGAATSQQQIVKVTAINGSTVTVSPGIYMPNWRASQNPKAFWWGGAKSGAGIEDLHVDTGSLGGVSSTIGFFQAMDSWVSGVGSHQTAARAHVRVIQSKNITVQSNWFDGSSGPGMGAYGVELYDSSDSLVVNNVFRGVTSSIMFNASATGNVLAYNYVTGATYDIQHHEAGTSFILSEGNDVNTIVADTFHGTNNFLTLFRNHVRAGGHAGIDLWTYNRYQNVIGNAIGPGPSQYECDNGNTAAPCDIYSNPASVFRLGYGYQNSSGGPCGYSRCGAVVPCDASIKATLMRWGNYDSVNAAARFLAAEVPTTDPSYPNAAPGSQTLPASFYFASKPSWWPNAKPWPSVGPDVTGGNIAGLNGHAYTNPANDCYTSNGGSVGNFNAATCYASGTPPPAPPKNLTSVIR